MKKTICPHLNCLVYHPDGVCGCDMARFCGECRKDKPFNDLPEKDQKDIISGAMKRSKKLQDELVSTTTQNDWAERFDKEFPNLRMYYSDGLAPCEDDVKAFIAKELAGARKEVIEEVEKLHQVEESDNMHCSKCSRYVHRRESYHDEEGYSRCCGKKLTRVQEKVRKYCEYNDAIDDVIATLRKEQG